MMRMRSKANFLLDAIGVFSLASFLLLGIFLNFIVDISPSCYFTDALIVYVECGKGLFNDVLQFYLQVFAPYLLMWAAPFMFMGVFVSLISLKVIAFLASL